MDNIRVEYLWPRGHEKKLFYPVIKENKLVPQGKNSHNIWQNLAYQFNCQNVSSPIIIPHILKGKFTTMVATCFLSVNVCLRNPRNIVLFEHSFGDDVPIDTNQHSNVGAFCFWHFLSSSCVSLGQNKKHNKTKQKNKKQKTKKWKQKKQQQQKQRMWLTNEWGSYGAACRDQWFLSSFEEAKKEREREQRERQKTGKEEIAVFIWIRNWAIPRRFLIQCHKIVQFLIGWSQQDRGKAAKTMFHNYMFPVYLFGRKRTRRRTHLHIWAQLFQCVGSCREKTNEEHLNLSLKIKCKKLLLHPFWDVASFLFFPVSLFVWEL